MGLFDAILLNKNQNEITTNQTWNGTRHSLRMECTRYYEAYSNTHSIFGLLWKINTGLDVKR